MTADITVTIKTIKEHLERGDKSIDRAEQHYISAGQVLTTLREGRTKAAWAKLVESRLRISTRWAYSLMQLGRGDTTLKQLRIGAAKRVAKHAGRKRALANAQNGSEEGDAQPQDERSAEAMVAENLDVETNPDAPVTAFMFQLTGALVAFQNCQHLLPMIEAMDKSPHREDWDELLLSTRQRAEQFAKLARQLEALIETAPATRRKKPILDRAIAA